MPGPELLAAAALKLRSTSEPRGLSVNIIRPQPL